MKLIACLLLAWLMTACTPSLTGGKSAARRADNAPTSGPVIVGNGGGAGEFYLFFTLRTFQSLVNVCTSQDLCSKDIHVELAQLQFAPPAKTTSLKILTSRELGADLYRESAGGLLMNQDLLFTTDAAGARTPWQYADAVRFLTTYWLAKSSSKRAATVADRLSALAKSTWNKTQNGEQGFSNFQLVQLSYPVEMVVIEDDSNSPTATTFELPLRERLDCGAAVGIRSAPQNLMVRSAQWSRVMLPDGASPTLAVHGLISYECADKDARTHRFSSRYRFQIPAHRDEDHFIIDQRAVTFTQEQITEE